MKLLLDQGLPISTVTHLKEANLKALHVSTLGMAMSKDAEILDYARNHGYTVVTLDSDFHSILASDQSEQPTVIRIRIESLKGPELAQLLVQIVSSTNNEILKGAAITVSENGIRLRELPLH